MCRIVASALPVGVEAFHGSRIGTKTREGVGVVSTVVSLKFAVSRASPAVIFVLPLAAVWKQGLGS